MCPLTGGCYINVFDEVYKNPEKTKKFLEERYKVDSRLADLVVKAISNNVSKAIKTVPLEHENRKSMITNTIHNSIKGFMQHIKSMHMLDKEILNPIYQLLSSFFYPSELDSHERPSISDDDLQSDDVEYEKVLPCYKIWLCRLDYLKVVYLIAMLSIFRKEELYAAFLNVFNTMEDYRNQHSKKSGKQLISYSSFQLRHKKESKQIL